MIQVTAEINIVYRNIWDNLRAKKWLFFCEALWKKIFFYPQGKFFEDRFLATDSIIPIWIAIFLKCGSVNMEIWKYEYGNKD